MSHRTTVESAEEILGLYFPVLDNGFVSLVDYMGGDEAIERAARVSYGHGTRATSQTRGLIRYLKRNAHTSPFEMAEVTLHCCMPIFIARQWVRHRTANLNEQSARYSLMPMVFYTPDREHVQLQSTDNKQGRAGTPVDETTYRRITSEQQLQRQRSANLYGSLTAEGVARELARIDLPLSTYTQWYWKIDLHNLMHFLRLRCDPHAQYEIRAFANVMAGILQRVAPLSFDAWVDYDLMGKDFSRQEIAMIATGVLQPGQPGASSEKEIADQYNLSAREVREFFAKLGEQKVPDFSLDLEKAQTAAYYEKLFADSLPLGT
jgi:thymidylate synthase (FAD)